MSGQDRPTTIGSLPDAGAATNGPTPRTPAVLTGLVWVLWVGSLGALLAHGLAGWSPAFAGVVAVDGVTVVMWSVVTFFSGIVHSYSRRYVAGSRGVGRFFRRVFGFTLAVSVLVAAEHAALFVLAWLGMGLVMADLIGYARGWPQARAAARLARRYFLASTALLAVAVGGLWWATGETAVSELATAGAAAGGPAVAVAAVALVLAAAVQSALVPFHTWLLASMTAPTPASALMHAGFVNAGGIVLVRFAPVATGFESVMLLALVVGAVGALSGKLLKSVRPDVKGRLGCSTVAQMGFMVMQAGLGFFGAAITHLVLHGFYKAYGFLSSGGRVEHTSPDSGRTERGTTVTGVVVTAATALAGGALFAALTGKGTDVGSGLVLTLLVVLTALHATWDVARRRSLPATVRYASIPLLGLPSIAVYAGVYTAVTRLLSGLPVVTAPTDLTAVHGAVVAAFLVAYVAIETGAYRRSDRLYVALSNAGRPPAGTLSTDRGEYSEY